MRLRLTSDGQALAVAFAAALTLLVVALLADKLAVQVVNLDTLHELKRVDFGELGAATTDRKQAASLVDPAERIPGHRGHREPHNRMLRRVEVGQHAGGGILVRSS